MNQKTTILQVTQENVAPPLIPWFHTDVVLFMPETKSELAGNVDPGLWTVEAVIVVLCVGVLVEMVALHLGRGSRQNLEKKEKEMH